MSVSVLMVDNFDSFTYNLVDYFKRLDCVLEVVRNDIHPGKIDKAFDLVVLSPGPGTPASTGRLLDYIDAFNQTIPIFGVCLGHQAIAQYFGGTLSKTNPVHGKMDNVQHDGKTIFKGIQSPMEVGRYHSLIVQEVTNDFQVSATNQDGIVMGIRHKQLPIESVQFHPESILSQKEDAGIKLLANFLDTYCR